MNCPNCGGRSRTWGIAKRMVMGKRTKLSESNYRLCSTCGTRWTEHRRIVTDSVRVNKHRLSTDSG